MGTRVPFTPRAAVLGLAVVLGSVAAVSAVVVGALRALLHRQARIARRRIGKPLGEDALDADRVWGRRFDGPPVELAVFGDSIAAGLGAERPKDTLGGRLAKGVARATRRPVRLRTAATVGAESSQLASQVDALPAEYRPDIAVVVVGGNDVTHRIPVATATAHLADAVHRLRARGAEVVVGTCPDLGALRPVPQPLRVVGSRLSRQMALAQEEAAVGAGALAVSLGTTVGPFFVSQPAEMFSLDRFHPSALGYRRTAEALLPAVLSALADPLSPRPRTPPVRARLPRPA
ncbi:SGNH/GDSL hydrolase family protein [Microbacterium sp. NPDC057407]|uniref:SGNH/GDSL hydrolase family protein n=1 Tax=Microbacterium sp. NPDC057407 TaxID=3346120 RepID=UPI00366CE5B9